MGKSPGIALVLSILPGFGHFYLGLWKQGLVGLFFGSAFVASIVGAAVYPIIVILVAFDAYKKAKEM